MAKLSDLMGYGRDFAQGASNAAASNISAPVDGLAWLLRKAGMNVQNPVGGSDWMRARGLTAEPQNRLAGLLGESVGGVAPMLAAAKAPQIAAGVNRMADNAMIPRRLDPQTGAVVWHGSPHKFDKFDSAKIGTGEGAQAYGHGIYTAESPDVARSYVQSVVSNSDELIKRGASHGLPDDVASNLAAAKQSGKNFDVMLDSAKKAAENPLLPSAQKMAAQRLVDHEMQAYNAWSDWSKPGSLYKVDLPDEHIARMLDYDAPLGKQAPEVRAAFDGSQLGKTIRATFRNAGIENRMESTTFGNALKMLKNGTGADASDQLRQAGIPGIRYLDGGSRGAGAGSSNYVVFPGNENLLSILERNGQKP